MMVGLAAWVLLVFVVPNMGATVAQAIGDVPPADRVEMPEGIQTYSPEEPGRAVAELPGHVGMRALVDRPCHSQEQADPDDDLRKLVGGQLLSSVKADGAL